MENKGIGRGRGRWDESDWDRHICTSDAVYNIDDGFPGSSAGKESACNAGAHSSIPGLRSSPGEGIG